jgi:hypothetical protein
MPEENVEFANRKKRLLYIGLFVFQILVVFFPMLCSDLILQGRTSMTFDTLGMMVTIIVLILITINIFFIQQFINRKVVLIPVVAIYAISYIVSTYAHISPDVLNNPEVFRQCNLFSMSCVFGNLCFTFYVAVKDIFRYKHDLVYSLVGAASIFLLIGSLFGIFIVITGYIFPGMVVSPDAWISLDNTANVLSFFTLASIDLPFDNVNPFIRTILVVESIFSHLFVVMIVGRLLSK